MSLMFKVLRPLPNEWRRDAIKLGETFAVIRVDIPAWESKGGAFYIIKSDRKGEPDFSGETLSWLEDNRFIELTNSLE